MNLDLRFNASLPPEVTPLFNKVSELNRNPFNEFIDSISRPLIDNIDWWSENVASRNTYASPLFHYFCCVKLIDLLLKEKKFVIEEIILDSKELKKILELLVTRSKFNKVRFVYSPGFTLVIKRYAKNIFYYEWLLFRRSIQLIIARLTLGNSYKRPQEKSLVLVDTFLTKEFLMEDRWYGSFWDHLNEEQKKEVFFVPTIINTSVWDIKKIFEFLRNSNRNNLIKDDFLNLGDLFYCYRHKRRVKNISIEPYEIEGTKINLSGLAQEDLRHNRDIFSLTESLLTYRFIYRLSEFDIKIRLAIDWFEGHSLDKLWNLAIKEFYPNVKRIGYETFRSFPYYLSTFPTKLEKDAGTIPDVFAVQGDGCIEIVKEFLSDIDVITIPAFKYEHVWNRPNQNSFSECQELLVTFPISVEASVKILDLLIDANNKDVERREDFKFLIKPHPTNSIQEITKKIKRVIPENFIFVEGMSFDKLLFKSSILITEASSTCLEAFAYGKPVIVVENPTGLTYDPVPKNIPNYLFKKCKDSAGIREAIDKFLVFSDKELRRNQKKGNEIRKEYFEKVSSEGIKRFLDIS